MSDEKLKAVVLRGVSILEQWETDHKHQINM